MRADAIRYFVLAHFGGIYVDMDDVSHVTGLSMWIQPLNYGVRDATAVLTLSYHTVPGLGRPHQLGSRTMRWGLLHNILSSSRSLRAYRAITTTGGFPISLWCTPPGPYSWVSSGRSTYGGEPPRKAGSGFWCRMSMYLFLVLLIWPYTDCSLMQVHQKAMEFLQLPQRVIMAQWWCSGNFLGKNEYHSRVLTAC